MPDALDQDVHALQEWLKKAWHNLAQPAHAGFERQEMRQQMKLVEAKLRIGVQKVAARHIAARSIKFDGPDLTPPNWRLLKIDA
jgi:hypothetical protein